MDVVKDELLAMRERFADERRTRIVDARGELSIHDLVAEEDHVVTLSHLGYIKRCSPDEWGMQRRGGHGKKGMNTRDEDFVTDIFIANTHSVLMVFTDTGKVYPLNVYEVPESGRTARGRPIVNLVPMAPDERIAAVVSVRTEDLEVEGRRTSCSPRARAWSSVRRSRPTEHPQRRPHRLRRRRRRRAGRRAAAGSGRRAGRHDVHRTRSVHPLREGGSQRRPPLRTDGPRATRASR